MTARTDGPATARIRELSTITIDSTDLSTWEAFGRDVLGMAVIETSGGLRLKMDALPFRFLVRGADRDGIAALGWRARDAAAVDAVGHALAAAGYAPTALGTGTAAGEVRAGLAFHDHQAIRHEVFDAPNAAHVPFAPGPNVSGYVTGAGGLGHIVFVDDLARCDAIYLDAYAMTLREDVITQLGVRGHFYGCNPRHHTAAVVDAGEPSVMHVMVEMSTVDDVGAALDRAAAHGWPPRTPLGRHRADHMLSFYAPTPGGFDIEIGCGGLLVDDGVWEATKDLTRARPWGHAGIAQEPPRSAR